MAAKPRSRKGRILSVCAWTAVLLVAGDEIARSHGTARFLPLFQIAVALMCILYEVKNLIEEPN